MINDIKSSGFSHNHAIFFPITRKWTDQSTIDINFPMDVNIHRAHPKVKVNRKKIALSRGPIVYCFESLDNPLMHIPKTSIDLSENIQPKFDKRLLGGMIKLQVKEKQGQSLIAIPYYSWTNRDPSAMQIWIKE